MNDAQRSNIGRDENSAERAEEKLHQKTTVRMGIRVMQRTTKPPLPATTAYSVPVTAIPSAGTRSQVSRGRVTFAENEITDGEGELPLSFTLAKRDVGEITREG